MIERTAPGRLHTDGETHETTAHVEVCVLPRSLKIMGPARQSVAIDPDEQAQQVKIA
jgi:hypothetical protein